MGYLATWKVLEEMIVDFRKKGVLIPAEIMSDLKTAKTLINVLRADPSFAEKRQRIEESLLKVESYLATEGQKKLGFDHLEKWLKRLDEACGQTLEEEAEEEKRFVHGVPREQKWIRVRSSEELPIETLKALAEESGLSYNVQSDGYLLFYGKNERMKEFVRKMTAVHGPKP